MRGGTGGVESVARENQNSSLETRNKTNGAPPFFFQLRDGWQRAGADGNWSGKGIPVLRFT